MDITVVIPCYNYGEYISDAIKSILAQTYPVREIIVVDDGSTDDTSNQLSRFGKSVKHLYQPHRGPSSARNTGIQAAKYPWIAFVDADDWWLPRKIERQVEALTRHPTAVLSYTSLYVVNGAEVQRIVPAPPSHSLF